MINSARMYRFAPRDVDRQRGVALFVALVFLIALTLLGVSLFGVATVEEKMARNFRDTEVAQEAADAALRDAEMRVAGVYPWDGNDTAAPTPVDLLSFSTDCTNGLCVGMPGGATQPVDKNYGLTGSLLASNGVTLGDCPGGCTGVAGSGAGTLSQPVAGVAEQPKYLIEVINWEPYGNALDSDVPNRAYRITAVGVGRSATTRVAVQSIYVSPLD